MKIEKRYGFIEHLDLSKENFKEGELSSLSGIRWAKTGDFNKFAKNHCAAVLVTNLALYYEKIGYVRLIENNLQNTFKSIHKQVGNGPKLFIAKDAKIYFHQRGYKLRTNTFRSFNAIKKSTGQNHPLGLLLTAGLFEWHWVMVVGWLETDSGLKYLKIVSGWDSKNIWYYKLGSGSHLWAATTYSIEYNHE